MADLDISAAATQSLPHYDTIALAAAASTVTVDKRFTEIWIYVDDDTNTARISTDGGSEVCKLPKQTWIKIWQHARDPQTTLTFDLDVDAGTPTAYLMCF